MTDVHTDTSLASGNGLTGRLLGQSIWIQLLVVAVAGVLLSLVWDGFRVWPENLMIPMKVWITDFFNWLGREAVIWGDFTFKDLTRSIAWFLKQPLLWSEWVLYRGIKPLGLKPIPWVALTLGVAILGHWIAGWRLALFVTACCLYIATFNLWRDSMKTLSVVIVAVPFAAIIGLLIGIWVTRSRKAAAFFTPLFDLMQATPHMAYLVPVVILFGFGQVPAMLATVIFAMPPMARCTILGIQTVPSDILESARMSGCTPRQMLWKVELPTSKPTLMLGLNQVVMQTLAMVVIASLVGATGLGQKLLYSLQQLKIGQALQQGVAIVLIAMVLDRMTQRYADRPIPSRADTRNWFQRHTHLLLFIVVVVVCYILANFFREVAVPPKDIIPRSFNKEFDLGVRAFTAWVYPYIEPTRDFLTVSVLIPVRNFFLWLPWPVMLGCVALAGWRLGGFAVMALTSMLVLAILLFGFWEPAMLTVYLVFAAMILCVLIGVPIGIWASRSPLVARIVMSICDTLQTFPSFIYLIPAIMLFKVGDLTNIIAIIPYATVPAIRYTYLGLKRVPEVLKEAAEANGCTGFQKFWKVELPVALPEMMLGINQTIMMALAMTAITALIGSRDLGQEIYRALPTTDTGRGLLAGMGIAAIGIIADRLIGAWAKSRKAALGVE